MQLSDAKILITGGAKGIGNFIANGLLEKVAKVVIIDYDKEQLSLLPSHEKLITHVCDVSNPFSVEKVIKQVFEQDGGINVCLNNAGIIHSEPLVNLMARPDKKHNLSNWKRVIDINLNGVFYVTSNVVEQLVSKRQKGVIINVSSIAAQGNVGQSAYSASKAAVEALTKTWSKELGMFKIRCACIAPGFFDTPSNKDSLSESMLTKWQKSIPLGRLGHMDELLSAVEFIIQNEFFNGKILSVDGGLNI